jgi:hypothetical protein
VKNILNGNIRKGTRLFGKGFIKIQKPWIPRLSDSN